ncbi:MULTISPECIES: thioredoxin fold domain-containing protein [Chryseobacterium]|uniref:Thiol-disulfide isomerase/thioredoxin n=1 Tax=Chryseobacterium geocarposphaerae TaxID=1416776 RepID=A0ABU1LEU1_9FLAO|nr:MULTISPECIES: thioredoxin fold domain-containing protein [Chryseobacterium]MDR6405075.1 thiol-disulfide isomerase/thioredoxin [Chryseobacterium geocarposphaerae]MDR6697858.1 thiol-disulfide isomerase/thioredoxin [Chryseobacterium ginsenosidimutans]
MKKIAMFSFLLMSIFTLCQGIKFDEGSFANILAKAKKENKLVFIDAYTSWCAPCKLMAKNIFPLQSVGDYYNSNFVNAKIDMEKGEGKTLAKRYAVTSFPTYLFINGDGEVVHRFGSSLSEAEFLQLGKDATDPPKQFSLIKKKFEKGEKDPVFLNTAIVAFLSTGNSDLAEKAMDQYFKQKSDISEDDVDLIASMIYQKPEGKYFDFFINKKDDILKVIKPESYNSYEKTFKTKRIVAKSYDKKTNKFSESVFLTEAEKYFGKEKAPQVLLQYKAGAALHDKNYSGYENLMLQILQDPASFSSAELNTAAWNFFEHVSNPSSLEKALAWARESVRKSEGYDNADTLANLYHKTGDKNNAKIWAEKAIELAKSSNRDYSETEKLLKSL